MLGEVGDAGSGPVGVGPLDHTAETAESSNHVVADATDDFQCTLARRVEAIEGVEDRRGVSSQKGQLLDEKGPGPGSGCGYGGARSGRTGAHDHDVIRPEALGHLVPGLMALQTRGTTNARKG